MLTKNIRYIGFYNHISSNVERNCSIAAVAKMDYICEVLNELGYRVNIISTSYVISNNLKFYKKENINLSTYTHVNYFASFGSKNKWIGYLKILITLSNLFFWLICNIKSKETIIVYHSPWLSLPVRFAKFIIGFKVILELEEIYSDVVSFSNFFDKSEKKLISSSNAYIIASDILKKSINEFKPFVVSYGRYKIEPKRFNPKNDGKIHIVYAGVIDSITNEAFNAIEIAQYLDNNYVLHIIGWGEIEKLLSRINEIQKGSTCNIIFDGLKHGDDYIKYIQECHIGLSTRNICSNFSSTSFPSKVLSYLSLGINVVSCAAEPIVLSEINKLIIFYHDDNPKSIAESIINAKLTSSDLIYSKIKDLHNGFLNNFNLLINKI